jgi:hypothetical protein
VTCRRPACTTPVAQQRRPVGPLTSPNPASARHVVFIPWRTFRLFKQVLGWTAPKIRDPAAADQWTWMIIACHAQLRLARSLAADLRRPWERPASPGRLTPARVRRGFRNIRATSARPAGAPKPGKPGPGRPPGSKNRRPSTRHDVGKTRKTDAAKATGTQQAG